MARVRGERGQRVIETARLQLRPWRESDRDAFAAMHADPAVMVDAKGPLTRERSDKKFDRYAAAFEAHGICRWAVESRNGDFLGYAGVMPSRMPHPLGDHFEIGWRLMRAAWGQGYASEAATAALRDAFDRAGLVEVLSYTAADNARSRAVMNRLALQRDEARDFQLDDGWRGMVWTASKAWRAPPA